MCCKRCCCGVWSCLQECWFQSKALAFTECWCCCCGNAVGLLFQLLLQDTAVLKGSTLWCDKYHKLCFRGWTLINFCWCFTCMQVQICSVCDVTLLLDYRSQDDDTPGGDKRGRALGWKVQLAEEVTSSVRHRETGSVCACVSCQLVSSIVSSCRSIFFYLSKMLQLVHDPDELRWQWTKASLTQSLQNKTNWVWWSWCFLSCVWEKRGGLCYHDFLQLVEQELLCVLGALQMNLGCSG